ncbi:PAS and helix-turn-helix domain-containing protein [Rhodobacteraceae bacterium D3-12]|nr:PAS and helix-turn-helix domain-containing protein [Rhodobacteraceae bacterium D3-12]
MDAFSQIAFDAAPVGLVLTEHRMIRACNETFAWLFGHERAALLGQSFRILYGTEHEFRHIRDIGLGQLSRGAEYSDERMMHRADGTPFWCRFRAHTLTPRDPLAQVVMSFARLAPDTPGPSLTPREREVVSWLSRGLTSKEIGRTLGLSPRTIEDVRARLLRKFQARNAADLLSKLGDIGM